MTDKTDTEATPPIEDIPTGPATDEVPGETKEPAEDQTAETTDPDAEEPAANKQAEAETPVEKPSLAAVPEPPASAAPPQVPSAPQPPTTPEDGGGRPPVNPMILGPLLPAEMQTLMGMQRQLNTAATEIGHLEIRKAKLLGTVDQIEKQVQEGMEGVSERLGITKGIVWTVGQDGMARLVPQQNPMGPGSPPGGGQ